MREKQMMWKFVFCVFSLVFTSSCGLLNAWESNIVDTFESQSTPNTIFSSQDMTEINGLLFPEDNCLFPCFGGLYPQESSIGDVEDFLEQFAIDESEVEISKFEAGGYGLSLLPEHGGLLLIDLLTEDNKLSQINLNLSHVYEWLSKIPYDLPDIFSLYGEPDDIFVLIAGPPLRFALIVTYNEKGFMFRYRATYNDSQLASNNEPLPICLHPETVDLQQINVWIQSPDVVNVVENNQPDLYEDREIRPWWNIQRLANVTVVEFVDFFVSNPQECFLLPSLSELREQGYVP